MNNWILVVASNHSRLKNFTTYPTKTLWNTSNKQRILLFLPAAGAAYPFTQKVTSSRMYLQMKNDLWVLLRTWTLSWTCQPGGMVIHSTTYVSDSLHPKAVVFGDSTPPCTGTSHPGAESGPSRRWKVPLAFLFCGYYSLCLDNHPWSTLGLGNKWPLTTVNYTLSRSQCHVLCQDKSL